MTKIPANSNTSSKVKVAVRVRPFNKREIDLNTRCVVDMRDDQTFLTPPTRDDKQSDKKQTKTFAFDHCFWSMDPAESRFADQGFVFQSLGMELLDNAFAGYNACIFAYGQTGSGKSFTMMGSHEHPGLIPRLCDVLFERIDAETKSGLSFKVEVSYMEIYNEKVRDLLDPNGGKQQLKVREHKVLGPYVDGLQQLLASSAHDVQELMTEGSKSRTVAATKMNAESSRSHAVFTLIVTHTMADAQSGIQGERVSKLSLVDLAGSERSSKTGASGARLKEGSNINKSLTTLGLVISALADQSAGKARNKFVPYRDSTLTWILKDNLGGNSRTTMVATLSPSADNYEETLSTLRYADRAKRIVNKAVVNEDPNARIIRELREEVERLQQQLQQSVSMSAPDLKEKLQESEKLIQEISQTWEEKLRKTELVQKKRQETFEKMGISLESSGIKLEKTKCFLVNLNADPCLNELLVYYLKTSTLIGQCEESDIQLCGLGIHARHAEMKVVDDETGTKVTVVPVEGARTCINGRPINDVTVLRHGDRILWGNNHFFRINVPKVVRKPKKDLKLDVPELEGSFNRSLDTTAVEDPVSYEDAQHEVLLNQADTPMQDTIMNLEREFQLLQGDAAHSLNPGAGNSPSVNLENEERKKYESEIDSLRRQLDSLAASPGQEGGLNASNRVTAAPLLNNGVSADYQKYRNWKDEREQSVRTSIAHLREQLFRAQLLVREANELAQEMQKQTEFAVTMRIPAHNLTSNRMNGSLLCEPAVQVVRQGKECQIWSVEKLSNRLVDMRDLYEGRALVASKFIDPLQSHALNISFTDGIQQDPFNDNENGQSLVGVANVFLSCLLQDAPLRYPLPVINQQGQVVGKLLVELQTISGSIPERMMLGGGVEDVVEDCDPKSRIRGGDSCNSFDPNLDLANGSDSSLSSGVGSSLSTDPPADSIKLISNKGALNASNSSLSSASLPTITTSDVERIPRRKILPLLTCRISIIEAQGLSATLSPYVECQFTMFNQETVVIPPQLTPDQVSPNRSSTLNIRFNYTQVFSFEITEEFVDHLTSNASLAIEVWGHRNPYHQNHHVPRPTFHPTAGGRSSKRFRNVRGCSLLKEKSKSLKERWEEVTKRLKAEVTIEELGDSGEYESVEIAKRPNVPCVGVFQLKQGHSRRLQVRVSPMEHSGTLPLICESIAAVYAGSITSSTSNQYSHLDSYQERDLSELRKEWLKALDKRKNHLQKQISALSNKENKTDLEKDREGRLFDQWLMMTEERNAVLAPADGSGVPGSPATWNPPVSCEAHVPIIFLGINSQPVECEDLIRAPAGLDSELTHEIPGTFVQLPFVRPSQSDHRGHVSALASWDSSMHDSMLLNRVTPSSDSVFVIVKVHIHLSHPVEMDLVLRKRICISVYKQRGFTATLRRRMQGSSLSSSGVLYEIVSNVPLATSDGEDHEALAMLAASGANQSGDISDSFANLSDPEDEEALNDDDVTSDHFEKFVLQATRSVDNILALDRIRQEVAIRDAFLERNSTLSPPGGLDVMSIISRKNRNLASSVYSGFTPYRPGHNKVADVS